MINREKTKLKYGYFPEDLAPTSDKKVVWSCEKDDCITEHDYAYAYCLKKKEKAAELKQKELCQKCSHSHRKGHSHKNDPTQKMNAMPLPPEVDLGKTMELFGINAEDLSPWSRQKVVLNCSCGKESITKRCSLNSSKSIIETGHYKCVGCWTKGRRKGVKVSDETKSKMKRSQQKRRGIDEPIPLRPAVAANGTDGIPLNKDAQVIPFRKK